MNQQVLAILVTYKANIKARMQQQNTEKKIEENPVTILYVLKENSLAINFSFFVKILKFGKKNFQKI